MLTDVGTTASEKPGAVNVAVTLLALVVPVITGVNVHVGVVAVHAPDHPANALPVAGVAVSVSGIAGKLAEHTPPQLIPAGLDVTVPEPVPERVTDTCGW